MRTRTSPRNQESLWKALGQEGATHKPAPTDLEVAQRLAEEVAAGKLWHLSERAKKKIADDLQREKMKALMRETKKRRNPKYRMNCDCQRNPRSEAERREFEREVAAWEAKKDLERALNWERYQRREEEEGGGRRKAERRRNPPPTFDTCPTDMDYDWWVQHYAPEHVREAARAKALAEAQRLYAPPPMTPAERAQVKREEAAYGRAMRRERKNPGVEQVVLLVLPYVIKSLGNKVSAFNGLSQSERERRVREFLRGSQRHLMGPAGTLLGPQAAKSDKIVRAIVAAVEHHGGRAVQAGGEAATARLTPATRNPRRR